MQETKFCMCSRLELYLLIRVLFWCLFIDDKHQSNVLALSCKHLTVYHQPIHYCLSTVIEDVDNTKTRISDFYVILIVISLLTLEHPQIKFILCFIEKRGSVVTLIGIVLIMHRAVCQWCKKNTCYIGPVSGKWSGVLFLTLLWRHNERDGVSNHRRLNCLLSRLFGQIKENIKTTRHWPLWGEFAGDRRIPRTKGQ